MKVIKKDYAKYKRKEAIKSHSPLFAIILSPTLSYSMKFKTCCDEKNALEAILNTGTFFPFVFNHSFRLTVCYHNKIVLFVVDKSLLPKNIRRLMDKYKSIAVCE